MARKEISMPIKQGDCLEDLQLIPDEHVDLTVFSPPIEAATLGLKSPLLDFSLLGKELHRVTKDGGVCAFIISDVTQGYQKPMFASRLSLDWVDNAGWNVFETCIYQRKGDPDLPYWDARFRIDHEYIVLFFKGERPKTFFNRGTKSHGTIWEYQVSYMEGNDLKQKHPGTYPDLLAEDLILCFSNAGELVLDPMCGSGTTCVMAQKHGRETIGIEINEKYFAIAEERMVLGI